MVTRNSQEAQFNQSEEPAVRQSGAGYKAPDYGKFSKTLDFNNEGVDQNSQLVLNTILGVAGKLAEKKWEVSKEEAYLDGVAKAGTIKNESELQGDPLTRDWQTAGFRDTMGRVSQAENQARIQADMKRQREVSPEKYQDYIAENRGKLLGSLEGMSLKSRQTQFASMLMDERSNIVKHGVEHAKFIVEQQEKAVQGKIGTAINGMNIAKSDGTAYTAATDAGFMTAYSAVVLNENLPNATKGNMIAELAKFALDSDHQDLYKRVMNEQVTLPDGSQGTMGSMMNWDQQVKANGEFRESMKRTEAFRFRKFDDDTSKMEADFSNPDAPAMTYNELQAHVDKGIQMGAFTRASAAAFLEKGYKEQAKKGATMGLAAAWVSNDPQRLQSLGATQQEGMSAWLNGPAKKMTFADANETLLSSGLRGNALALKAFGERNTQFFSQLGNSETANPALAQSAASLLQRVQQAEDNGQTGMMQSMLSGMPEDVQAKMMHMRSLLRDGRDPATAALMSAKQAHDQASMTPAMKAAMAQGVTKGAADAVADVVPRGMLESGWLRVKALAGSSSAATELALRPEAGWFTDPKVQAQVTAQTKIERGAEYQRIATTYPMYDAETVKGMADAALLKRQVPTEHGPVYVPMGMTPQKYFGVPASTSADRIGAGISEFIKPEKGNRIVYSSGPNGEFLASEVNKQGQVVKPDARLNPADVGRMVATQEQRKVDKYKRESGPGIKVTDPETNLGVQFNGDNSANIDNGWMVDFRKSLVEHERVVNKPYPDLSGKKDKNGNVIMTVGAGVSSHNEHYPKIEADGTVSPENIQKSLMGASNQAAQQAQRVMYQAGISGKGAFSLMAEMAYQGGPGALTKGLVRALQTKDAEEAERLLRASPPYKWAGNNKQRDTPTKRQQHYLDSLQAALKGN